MPHSIESHIFDTWPADSNSGVRSPASQPPQPADCLPQAMIAAAKEMREVMREFKEMQMATLAANARTAEITAQTRASTIERMIQANTIATETATRQHRQTVEALIAACTHTTDAHIRAANAAGRERTTQMQTLFETLHRPNEHKDLIEQSHELIKNLLTEIRDLRLQVNDLNMFANNVAAQPPPPPRATRRSASAQTTHVSSSQPDVIVPIPSPAPRALQPRLHTNVLPTFPIIAQPSLIAALPANWDDLLRAVFPRRDAPLYELFLSSIPRPRCTRHHQRSAQTNWNFSVVNRSLFFFQPSAAGYRIRRIYNPHPTALLV